MFLFKRSNGFYYFYFIDKFTGKRKAVSTKCKDKNNALKFVKSYDQEASPNLPQIINLDTLAAEALNYASNNLSHGSYVIYKSSLTYLVAIIGNKPLRAITGRDIEFYKETRIKHVKKTTCNIEIRTLKAVFNLAVKWNWLHQSPLKSVKEFPIPEREPIAFKDHEIRIILDTIDNAQILNIVLFALYTGCRIGEILNVQLKDLNLNERVITIGNKDDFTTKSRKYRHIPISDNLHTLIKSLLKMHGNIITYFEPDTYLFNKNGFKLNKNYVSKTFKKYLRLAGLPEIYHFHCLRHYTITSMIRNGVDINTVRELAGHADISTTLHYTHSLIEDKIKAVNKIKIL